MPARHKHEEEISKLNLPHVSPEQPPFVGKPELEVKDRVFYGEEGHVYLPDGLYVCEESGECCGRQAQAER